LIGDDDREKRAFAIERASWIEAEALVFKEERLGHLLRMSLQPRDAVFS
jgi:hypothetical protein